MNKSKKGFTLIELIVVLAILAVIAAIAVPTAFGAIDKAKIAADTASIESYNSALRTYASILQIGDYTDADNTCLKALESANFDKTLKPQTNNKIEVKAEYEDGILRLGIIDVGYKPLVNTKTLYEQIVYKIGTFSVLS
ncbi:MAG: prepilin-type N-terminal cleavage/methylation domain-containing protein [Oscillospiraceae bacterium]